MLDELSPAQREAVTTTEGYVRVIAGAGSGKTRALSQRFAYLVNELGVLPGNILCVTFTNKAANEMRARIHRLTGDNDTAYVNTFHGFCATVLMEDSSAINYPKSFLVLDNSDIDSMLRIIYEERGLTLRDMTFSRARDMFEMRKCRDEPLYWQSLIDMSAEQLRLRYESAQTVEDILFWGYLHQQKKCYGLDYNDLIILTMAIFERDRGLREKWTSRLQYIMIDEFQDIDPLQYRLMEVLASYHGNLFVVGDPDQTIYTWRGADVRFLMEFADKHPPCTTIMMNENWRSTPEVVALANSLISKNATRIDKSLQAMRPAGELPLATCAESAEAEGAWIAEQIQGLVEGGMAHRDIAVLYRAHYVTRSVEEALIEAQVPYRISSGAAFFDRAEVKDALSYLRMVAYGDDLSFERTVNAPKRNFGESRMKLVRAYAAAQGVTLLEATRRLLDDPLVAKSRVREYVALIDAYVLDAPRMRVSELLARLLDESGYERALRTEGAQERLDNLAELRQAVYEYEASCGEEPTLERFLAHAALYSDADRADAPDKVRLMTVHAAKGLEFKAVFLCGMNEGIFPSRKVRTVEGMEEERRLAFVAATRARDRLFISQALGVTLEGAPRYPSRFILDIDQALLRYDAPPAPELVTAARDWIAAKSARLLGAASTPAFAAGQRVRHRVFGEGTVIGVDEQAASVTVRFDGLATPRSLSVNAPLERA